MADNVGYTPGSGATVAADDIAGVLYQRVKIGIGGDGSATDLSSANPMPIATPSGAIDVTVGNFPASQAVTGPLTDAQLRASAVPVQISDPSATTSFGPITTASTLLFGAVDTANENSIQMQLSGLWDGGIWLQASNDGLIWFAVRAQSDNAEVGETDAINSPDLFSIPVVARYFRAITSPDFSGTVSGSYALRAVAHPTTQVDVRLMDIDPSFSMPVVGVDPGGNPRRIAVAPGGGLVPADGTVITGSRNPATVGPIVQFETTGYGSVLLQLQGTFTGTITFQVSNDGTSWQSAVGWPVSGAAVPVTTATAVGQWVFPASGRFFRAQITTAGTGVPLAIAVLKNWSAWNPTNAQSINVAQIGGTAVVTGGVAGIQAVGGNIAVGAAPTANPVPIGGWDGTNTRRILTDAVSGGVALGAAGVSNGASVSTLISAATNNLTQLKATLGKVFIIDIQNTVASIRYLKLFNLPSASVTMGTTNATLNFSIPASGKLTIVTDLGINLGGSGISYALTGGSALNDNTAIGAGDLICNFQFV